MRWRAARPGSCAQLGCVAADDLSAAVRGELLDYPAVANDHRFLGYVADVRCHHDGGQFPQRMMIGKGFLPEDVEPGHCDLACPQRFQERLLVDDCRTRGVDKYHSSL